MSLPRSQATLLAEQLRRAFDGDAWHGPALLELLADIDAPTAAAKPIPERNLKESIEADVNL